MKSISYYIILLVLRIKGFKKTFSEDPIDYKKVRQEDRHHLPKSFARKFTTNTFKIMESPITELKVKEASKTIILFLHGGAFISGPGQHHWMTCARFASQTNATVWLANYPKAPEHKIDQICDNIDAIYQSITSKYKDHKIVLIGDSAGGNLCITLSQRLARTTSMQPSLVIAVSPVMDSSMSNPKIPAVDKVDPMLGAIGVRSAKGMCSVNGNLKDPKLSPLFGSFDAFPPMMLFAAENDVTFPDQELAIQKMQSQGVELDVHIGKGMMHVWPFLPGISEGKVAMDSMIERIKKLD